MSMNSRKGEVTEEFTTLRRSEPSVPAELVRSVSLDGVDNCLLQVTRSRSSLLFQSCYTDVGDKLQPAQAGFIASHWQVSGEME